MKAENRNIYHIFTMGFCDAPEYNSHNLEVVNRIEQVEKIIPYLQKLNINTVLFGPLNESTSHGYDTIDYSRVDHRLGDKIALKKVIDHLKEAGIEVFFDCVFNHVGRDHPAFIDLRQNRENSRYRDWFMDVNFYGNNSFGDGLSYANWAGCDDLVKLNLYNPEVRDYLKENLKNWIEEYDIDGVRMDAANVMDRGFLAELADFARSLKPDFMLIGEIVGGDYAELMRNGHLDSVTNYECYKGLYSSLNDRNYFEIAHSIRRLFDRGGLIADHPVQNFVDNHDVNRVASTLRDKELLKPLYILLYTMPGIPSVYYGSEQGIEGRKGHNTDRPLRPPFSAIDFDSESEIFKLISKLGQIRNDSSQLKEGEYRELFILPEQYGFLRELDGEAYVILLNMSPEEKEVNINLHGTYEDLLADETLAIDGKVLIPASFGRILKQEKEDVR